MYNNKNLSYYNACKCIYHKKSSKQIHSDFLYVLGCNIFGLTHFNILPNSRIIQLI